MRIISRLLFFNNQLIKQMKKKWPGLLLLFLFPIFLVSLLVGIVASLIVPMENNPIRVVIVDKDDTKESELFSKLVEETASDNEFLQIVTLSDDEAQKLMDANEISAYFSFPKGFTKDLYEGNSVAISLVGNPLRQTETLVVKEMLESMTRLLVTAQASILTINDHAKELELSKEKREELLFKQFIDFTLYTVGKNKLLDEEIITNVSTSSPKHYYAIAGWFTLTTIWLLGFYLLTGKEEHFSMRIRLKLMGVTEWQRMLPRIVISLVGGLIFGVIAFLVMSQYIHFDLYLLDYSRFSLFVLLYALLFLICIAILEVVIPSQKTVLLIQSLFALFCIFSSGAIIPIVYFPQEIQFLMVYLFSYESFEWMIDIVLEGRNYADFTKMFVFSSIGLVLLRLVIVAKERWSE